MRETLLVLLTAAFVFYFGFVTGLFVGTSSGRGTIEMELVASGHAEYYLDKDFKKQWRMKPLNQ